MSCVMKRTASRSCSLRSQQQVEHVQPDRNIEHRDRLIRQQDLWPRRQRAGNRHALALATAQLVWILLDELLGRAEADRIEQRQNLFALLPAIARMSMQAQRAAKNIVHVMVAIERRERVLEDHLDMAAIGQQRGPALVFGRLAAIQ